VTSLSSAHIARADSVVPRRRYALSVRVPDSVASERLGGSIVMSVV
jgi:hypothetical protein